MILRLQAPLLFGTRVSLLPELDTILLKYKCIIYNYTHAYTEQWVEGACGYYVTTWNGWLIILEMFWCSTYEIWTIHHVKRIVQSIIYFWYLKEEPNLSILVKVVPKYHAVLRYWQLKVPHFLPVWTWSKQMWCHGCTYGKSMLCYSLYFSLLFWHWIR